VASCSWCRGNAATAVVLQSPVQVWRVSMQPGAAGGQHLAGSACARTALRAQRRLLRRRRPPADRSAPARRGAARLGLRRPGYDTERSTDHGWGLRLLLFLEAERAVPECATRLDAGLPERFGGWPVRFGWNEVAPLLLDRRYAPTRSGWVPRSPGCPTRTAWPGTCPTHCTPAAPTSVRRPWLRPTARWPCARTPPGSPRPSTSAPATTTRDRRRCCELIGPPRRCRPPSSTLACALPVTGWIDQFVDSTAVLAEPSSYRRLSGLFAGL